MFFGGICPLHSEERKVSNAKSQQHAGSKENLAFGPANRNKNVLGNVGGLLPDYMALQDSIPLLFEKFMCEEMNIKLLSVCTLYHTVRSL
jgi:hypothetical protein